MLDTLIVVVVGGLYLMVFVLAVLSLVAVPALVIASWRARGAERSRRHDARPAD